MARRFSKGDSASYNFSGIRIECVRRTAWLKRSSSMFGRARSNGYLRPRRRAKARPLWPTSGPLLFSPGDRTKRSQQISSPELLPRLLLLFQQSLLVFGQSLLHNFNLLKTVFEHGLFGVFLGDTDGCEQDCFCRKSTVRHRRRTLYIFVPGKLYGGFGGGAGFAAHGLVDGHELRAVEDALDCGKIGVLSGDQHFAGPAFVFK